MLIGGQYCPLGERTGGDEIREITDAVMDKAVAPVTCRRRQASVVTIVIRDTRPLKPGWGRVLQRSTRLQPRRTRSIHVLHSDFYLGFVVGFAILLWRARCDIPFGKSTCNTCRGCIAGISSSRLLALRIKPYAKKHRLDGRGVNRREALRFERL